MAKILLQLVVILFVSATAGQLLVLPSLQDTLFKQQKSWALQYLVGGSLELVVEHLATLPEENRKSEMNKIKHQFGFDIAMYDFADVPLSSAQKKALSHDGVVTQNETESVYRVSRDREFVVAFKRIETPAEHITSQAQWWTMGAFSMIERQLNSDSRPSQKEAITKINEVFQYPVSIEEIATSNLSDHELRLLQSGQIIWRESDGSVEVEFPFEVAMKKVPDQERVIVLGPVTNLYIKHLSPILLQYYLAMSLVLLAPLIIWLIPTWRSIKGLSRAASQIGKGKFDVRAPEYKGSNIANYVNSFNAMAAEIQKLITVNKSLVNAVSHELRTPLARIEFDLELARSSVIGEEQSKVHDRIENSVEDLKNLINEMLGYAKFEQEEPKLELSQVNIKEWLHGGVERWRKPNCAASIKVLCNGEQSFTALDRFYMDRALNNLVGNACKFAKSEIVIGFSANLQNSKIWVEDDGPGITSEQRDKVFEPFIRLDKSRNKETGGIGLGLAIVKQIIKWHGGSVKLESSSMGGAKFVMSWPNVTKK